MYKKSCECKNEIFFKISYETLYICGKHDTIREIF